VFVIPVYISGILHCQICLQSTYQQGPKFRRGQDEQDERSSLILLEHIFIKMTLDWDTTVISEYTLQVYQVLVLF
jgi:hypothetical protein